MHKTIRTEQKKYLKLIGAGAERTKTLQYKTTDKFMQ